MHDSSLIKLWPMYNRRVPSPRPPFNPKDAEKIVSDVYGLQGDATEMPSYDDRNFRIDCEDVSYTLKISMASQPADQLDMQDKVFQQLAECSFAVPAIVPTLNGGRITELVISDDEKYLARLLTFLPGTMLADIRPQIFELMREFGRAVGELTEAMQGFEHTAMNRQFDWDLLQSQGVLDESPLELIRSFAPRYDDEFYARLDGLRKSVIHDDPNDYNVLAISDLDGQRITGVFDFGDVIQTATVADLAIAASYSLMQQECPLNALSEIVRGYHEVFPLQEDELSMIFDLVCLRACTSAHYGALAREAEPDNEYISVHEKGAEKLLTCFAKNSREFAHAMLRHACGFDPHPETTRAVEWLKENGAHNVVDADFSQDDYHVIDLSPGNTNPVVEFANKESGWGIGQYAEPRLIYASDSFKGTGERRTVHIGLDLGKPAGTPVFAPLDGTVVSCVNNDIAFDYGPTVILEHELPDGTKFATLYGHLALEFAEGIEQAAFVKNGQQIATFGDDSVNGGWPPHLHFQILPSFFREIDSEGNFPGVAYASELELWKKICPDPNIIVGLPEDKFINRGEEEAELLAKRKALLGPSLSVSYNDPLKIVKGQGQFLFDQNGRQFLDCVNNVCHVGHCHPRVVDAGQKQMSVLNTNTRYLHDNIVRYSEKLLSKFPDELEVVFFTNSGSEANELALRMAKIFTGATDFVVIDGAYHGNSSALIEISPYKFDGAGGHGKPSHVHVATMPDSYRGDGSTGEEFAEDVRHKCEDREIAAFIAESMLGCGGQIQLPEEYLRSAFLHARRAGALCIVDEVQTGFGRVGSHYWAFETQGVVPDIVTLGKPMGNGHPLAAVITTREIADAFANGMEYFNTFGGNPVSCAIGEAVLDVIEEESLQQNAKETGEYLMRSLKELRDKYPLIGNVRGRGLFLGVELVLDRETLQPAAREADHIVNRMRHLGVLINTDGPLHNVLKIKPPIVFTKSDADLFVSTLAEILDDSCLQI